VKETKKILRQAIYDALDGQITINSEAVPVYDEKNTGESIYILLSNQQETDDNTSDVFITLSTIDIEVVQQTGYSVSKDDIDDITDQMLEILIPTPSSNGLTAPTGFQFNHVRRESSRSLAFEISPTESIIRNITTISTIITQQ
jgi:hypothetical protein